MGIYVSLKKSKILYNLINLSIKIELSVKKQINTDGKYNTSYVFIFLLRKKLQYYNKVELTSKHAILIR